MSDQKKKLLFVNPSPKQSTSATISSANVLGAVFASWAARASSALYTLIAFPIMLGALGQEKFAFFLYAITFPSWLAIAALGSGQRMAYFTSRSRTKGASRFFRARVGISLGISIALIIACALVASALIVFSELGSSQANRVEEATTSLLVSLWLTAFMIIGGPLDLFALGIGKFLIFNVTRIAILFVSLLVIVGIFYSPLSTSVPAYIIATLLPQVVLLYSVGLFVLRRARAFPIFSFRLLPYARSRINTTVTYGFFFMTLPFTINVQLSATVAAAFYGADNLGLVFVLLRVLVFVAAFFGAVVTSSWPQLCAAHTNDRGEEFRELSQRLLIWGSSFIAILIAAFAAIGPTAMELWLPGIMGPNVILVRVFGIFIGLYLWSTIWISVLSAMGQVRYAGQVCVLEAMLGLALSLTLMAAYGPLGFVFGLVTASAITSVLAGLRTCKLVFFAGQLHPS